MSADALPYALLIVLVQLAAGSLAVGTLFDARAMVTRGYIKLGGLVVAPLAAMALAVFLALEAVDDLDGYALRPDRWPALRLALVAFTAVAILYLLATLSERRRAAVATGTAGTVLGALVLAAITAVVAAPTWSYAGTFAGMLAGALVLGGALMAMSWGHWYLTNSGLPKEPLEQMSLLVLVAVGVQAALVLLAAVIPVREAPLADSLDVALGANPAFWLRVLVGLVFPLLLATLAWRAASIRGMMSATGLLYIALGAVLAGELMGRGLLFATGAPV